MPHICHAFYHEVNPFLSSDCSFESMITIILLRSYQDKCGSALRFNVGCIVCCNDDIVRTAALLAKVDYF